jgi:hypothetical protein
VAQVQQTQLPDRLLPVQEVAVVALMEARAALVALAVAALEQVTTLPEQAEARTRAAVAAVADLRLAMAAPAEQAAAAL